MRPCIVVFARNDSGTVTDVAGAASGYATVFVVDDGSSDSTPLALAKLERVTVVHHPERRGKGAALQSAFGAARERGYTHAITLDGDGRHPPQVLESLLARPDDALVVGEEPTGRAGFWTWVETGLRVAPGGPRRYPLAAIEPLRLVTNGREFETEALVKATWADVPVRCIEVAETGRAPRARSFAEAVRALRLHVRLVLLRLGLPAPYLALIVQRRFYEMTYGERFKQSLVELFVKEPGSDNRIALSVGLGLFMGIAPIWGFQIAATLLVAHATGLSKPVAVVASHISVPVFIPAILYASLVLGRIALGTYDGPIASVRLEPSDFPAWIVGSLLLASAAAIVGALLTWISLKCLRPNERASSSR
ncbi:MAG: DUF2062 domain-containing protein [Planctomycetota bacterium]